LASNEATYKLDNPVWHTLKTDHAHFGRGTALAKRYPPSMTLAVALSDHSEAAIADLTKIVPSGRTVAIIEANPPSELPGWTIQDQDQAIQMVCERPVPEPDTAVPLAKLTKADVPDMLALIDLARPGPFSARTIEMGRYFGIRQEGQLVAMAGERMSLPGYREISAVCTHPEHQGHGYASQLVSWLLNDLLRQEIVPFLHVRPDNARAYQIYEALNFRRRREVQILILKH